MNHLTLDVIIDFVSLTEINEESIEWMGMVNAHIAQCRECRELVRSYQLIYDETLSAACRGDNAVHTTVAEGRIAAIRAADAVKELER